MKTRASAVMHAPSDGQLSRFQTIEVELDEPRQNELLIRMVAAGLCHSDDHLQTGDQGSAIYPMIGGHEGAGIVEAIGPNTPGFEVGDHVVFSFIASCGKCRWCATGQQNLCNLGAHMETGARLDDADSFRFHAADGSAVGQFLSLGTFSEHTLVSVDSAVKVDKDLPLDKLVLLGCGVGTGLGSAFNSAQVRPGQTVIVMGVGGIGINAVQGAAMAGAMHVIAVDPVEFKRETALKLGATVAFADIEEATQFAKEQTNGQGADSTIVTIGVVKPEHVGQAMASIRKAGTVVVTGLGNMRDAQVPISLFELTLFQKRLQGSLFGQMNASWDILSQTQLYRSGKLKLDELVTTTYALDEVAQGYDDMRDGKNIRGVVVF